MMMYAMPSRDLLLTDAVFEHNVLVQARVVNGGWTLRRTQDGWLCKPGDAPQRYSSRDDVLIKIPECLIGRDANTILAWVAEHLTERAVAQEAQRLAYDAMYEALHQVRATYPELSHKAVYAHPEYQAKKQAYEASVSRLEDLLGVEAHCSKVDMDLWNLYSDMYKDTHGFRPRGMHVTRAEAQRKLTAGF